VALTGEKNTLVGCDVASDIGSGGENTILGYNAGGGGVTTAANNVLLGAYAGNNLTSGNSNVIIGHEAGSGLILGGRNVVIGSGIDMNGNFSRCIVLGSPEVSTTPTADNQLLLNGIAINGTAFAGGGGATPGNVESYLPILLNNIEYRIPLYRSIA